MTDAFEALPSVRETPPAEPPAFHAPGDRQKQHPLGATVHDGLTYACLNGYRELHLDVYVPSDAEAAVPCVVWIHGGAWLFGGKEFMPDNWDDALLFQTAINAGLAVAAIDYRHSREASFPAQLHDAKAAVRYLRKFASELGIDPERIAVWGDSAGGHLAALLATVRAPELEGVEGVVGPSSAVSAAVSFYGVADVDTMPSFLETMPQEWIDELRRAGGDAPPEPIDVLLAETPFPRETARRLVSPVHHVDSNTPPFLLVHGVEDGLVPISQSEEFVTALHAAGVEAELVRVPGADHTFVGVDPAPLILRAVDFLQRQFDRESAGATQQADSR
ncbi:alpha/beta hydrolase [Microbacterium sp. X-17]|uniref:alpha/beta hydrolase n=1 Tax=Microbacterium sp. X-17 TaxID=3144404 RepID=UPI0031F50346